MNRSLKTILWATVVGVILNCILAMWMNTRTLNTFRFSNAVHSVEYQINDLFHPLYKYLEKDFDTLIESSNLETLIKQINSNWTYRDDHPLWDVASPPVQSYLEFTGDCDDYARLMTYILHRKQPVGFVYYVTMTFKDTGHAVAAYFDIKTRKINVLDVNGIWVKIPVTDFRTAIHIPAAIESVFYKTIHIDVRTWDTRRSIIATTTNKIKLLRENEIRVIKYVTDAAIQINPEDWSETNENDSKEINDEEYAQ